MCENNNNNEDNDNIINENYISKEDFTRKTLEQRVEVITMFENGWKQKDIASKLNKSIGNVKYWIFKKETYKKELDKLNSGNNIISIKFKSTKSKILEAIKMHENGKEFKEISSKLNITYKTAWHWIKYKNHYLKNQSNTCQKDYRTKWNEKMKAINMFLSGSTISEIALKMNKSYNIILNWIIHKDVQKLMYESSMIKNTSLKIPIRVVEAIKMYENGWNISMAAFKCKTSISLMRYWLRLKENESKNVIAEVEKKNSENQKLENNIEKSSSEMLKDDKMYEKEKTIENITLNINTKNEKLEYCINDDKNHILKSKFHRKSINSKLKAVEMYLNGKKLKDIASQINVSISTVHRWVKYEDHPEKPQKDKKTLKENVNIMKDQIKALKISKNRIFVDLNKKLKAVEMYLHGVKVKDISAQFNISIDPIYKWVHCRDDLMKEKNDLNNKNKIIAALKHQKQNNLKIKLENISSFTEDCSNFLSKPREVKLKSHEINVKKEPMEPIDF